MPRTKSHLTQKATEIVSSDHMRRQHILVTIGFELRTPAWHQKLRSTLLELVDHQPEIPPLSFPHSIQEGYTRRNTHQNRRCHSFSSLAFPTQPLASIILPLYLAILSLGRGRQHEDLPVQTGPNLRYQPMHRR